MLRPSQRQRHVGGSERPFKIFGPQPAPHEEYKTAIIDFLLRGSSAGRSKVQTVSGGNKDWPFPVPAGADLRVTEIWIPQLLYFAVEAVRQGRKCKSRTILFPPNPGSLLLEGVKRTGVGPRVVFHTQLGHQQKRLCGIAKANPSKALPHNLRKLFARILYSIGRKSPNWPISASTAG